MFEVQTHENRAYRPKGKSKKSLPAALDNFHALSRDAEPALWRLVETDEAGKVVRVVKKFDLRKKTPARVASVGYAVGVNKVSRSFAPRKGLDAQATEGQL